MARPRPLPTRSRLLILQVIEGCATLLQCSGPHPRSPTGIGGSRASSGTPLRPTAQREGIIDAVDEEAAQAARAGDQERGPQAAH